jgi:hypothetical protein
VPSIFIVIEGTGATMELGGVDAYNPIILRPGRCYFRPANGDSVTLTVNSAQKGPLKVALAHENLHIEVSQKMYFSDILLAFFKNESEHEKTTCVLCPTLLLLFF